MIERGGIPGVMCKEEALTLTYELSWMWLPNERKIDYEQMMKDAVNTKELIKDDTQFAYIFQDFALEFLDQIKAWNDKYIEDCFESSAIFDACVHIMVRELRHKPFKYFCLYKPTRIQIMNSIID